MPEEPGQRTDSVNFGVGFGILLHLLQLAVIPAVIALLSTLFPKLGWGAFSFSIMGWSVTQFLYMGPAILIARRKGRTETAKGILIVAAIGVLLNGACDALLFGLAAMH